MPLELRQELIVICDHVSLLSIWCRLNCCLLSPVTNVLQSEYFWILFSLGCSRGRRLLDAGDEH